MQSGIGDIISPFCAVVSDTANGVGYGK